MRLVGYCHPQDVAEFRKTLDAHSMGHVRIQPEPMLERCHWYVVDFDKAAEMTTRIDTIDTVRPYTLAEREGE